MKQKKAQVESHVSDMTIRMNHYSTSWIYPTSVKVSQYRMVAKNRRKKEEEK